MRRLVAILVVIVCGCLGAAGHVSATDWQVDVREACRSTLLPNDGVLLTTTHTIRNARGRRTASVRIVTGWSVGRAYPKAKTVIVVRVRPGQSARRVVTRKIPRAPRLWKELRKTRRIGCASTYEYTIS